MDAGLSAIMIPSGCFSVLSKINWKRIFNQSFAIFLVCNLFLLGCGGGGSRDRDFQGKSPVSSARPAQLPSSLTEVAPPETLQALNQVLDRYQPQVKIISPQPGDVLEADQVSVKLQVKDLPIFKDERLGIGSHLDVVLDDRPNQVIYDVREPLVLSNLEPGTHTLRVFASRPWHESFKNEGSFAQVTFHLFTQTNKNNPSPNQPLLTYNSPAGQLGAEPVLVDFYLTNAQLRLAKDATSASDRTNDWHIRCTINGQSFLLDRWQPLYLSGFKPGKNWVRLELVDAQGQIIGNAFNDTVQVIDYQPNGQDTLSKLIRGDIKLAKAKSLILPGYQAVEEPEPIQAIPEKQNPIEPTPEIQETPVNSIPAIAPFPTPTSEAVITPEPVSTPDVNLDSSSTPQVVTEEPAAIAPPAPKKGWGIFFSRSASKSTPDMSPAVIEEAQPPIAAPTSEPNLTSDLVDTPVSSPEPATEESAKPEPEAGATPASAPGESIQSSIKARWNKFLNRLPKRSQPEAQPKPELIVEPELDTTAESPSTNSESAAIATPDDLTPNPTATSAPETFSPYGFVN